jgi:hypothetical protein
MKADGALCDKECLVMHLVPVRRRPSGSSRDSEFSATDTVILYRKLEID